MSVRAKMQLSETTEYAYGGKRVKFVCQYDPTIDEDKKFCKATPSGEGWFLIDNPAALEQLKNGEFYYVDFTPVPKS